MLHSLMLWFILLSSALVLGFTCSLGLHPSWMISIQMVCCPGAGLFFSLLKKLSLCWFHLILVVYYESLHGIGAGVNLT
jgi:hypothetical protein